MKLIQGDCLEVMKTLPDNSVDLTVTSPPYDNLRTYNGYVFNFEGIAKQLYRVTRKGGVVVWVVGDATIKGSETGTSFKQALYFKDVCGFNLHDTMIYRKKSNYAHDPRNKRYKAIFEYMFIFSKGTPQTYNEIKDNPNIHAGKRYSGGKGRNNKGQLRSSIDFIIQPFQARYNIWKITTDHNSEHPAIFPEKLAHDHIISWSNEGDTVFDPMMGSGTTGKMAKILNRKFIGIEISKEYFGIATRRIEDTDPLFQAVEVMTVENMEKGRGKR